MLFLALRPQYTLYMVCGGKFCVQRIEASRLLVNGGAGTRQLTAALNFGVETSSVCNTSQNAIYGGAQGIQSCWAARKSAGNVIINSCTPHSGRGPQPASERGWNLKSLKRESITISRGCKEGGWGVVGGSQRATDKTHRRCRLYCFLIQFAVLRARYSKLVACVRVWMCAWFNLQSGWI